MHLPSVAHLLRRLAFAGCWLALGVYFLEPVTRVLEPDLDSSIHASYAYFTAHGTQFGPQANTTAGPYGFVMFGWDYGGELYWQRLALVSLFALALSALVLWLFRSAGGGWRWLWLAAMLLGLSIGDTLYAAAVLLSGIFLLATFAHGFQRWRAGVAAVFLGFLALTKGTQLALTLGVQLCVLLLAWRSGQWRRAFAVWATFALSLAAWWIAAGQNVLHLPSYLNGLREIARGYNEAMALETPPAMLAYGATLLAALAGLLGWTAWRHRRQPETLAITALLAGFAFVLWKHGYLRSDDHMLIFTDFAALAALTVPVLDRALGHSPARGPARVGRAGLVLAIVAISVGATQHLHPDRLGMLARYAGERWLRNLRYVTEPERVKAEWDLELTKVQQRFDLPGIRHRIGDQPVDCYGHELGLLFLNGFRYHPPPMCCGTYHVYNAYFKERNHRHYANPATRPGFIVFKFQTIDQRFAPMDDSLSLLDLLDCYRPVLLENEALLLQSVPTASPVPLQTISSRRFRLGEDIPVPVVGPNELLLFSVQLPTSLPGEARAFFYKPPLLFMDAGGTGLAQTTGLRVIAGSLAVPTLLNPTLETTEDFLNLLAGRLQKRVTSFRLRTGQPACFRESELTVTFYKRPCPTRFSAGEMRRMRAPGVFRDPPDRVVPEEALVSLYHGKWVQYLHVPTEITYDLRGDERAVNMVVGVDENAYRQGRTDGVEFVIEIEQPHQPRQVLARRLLNPLFVPEDRGTHRVVGYLPPTFAPGSRLILRSAPGPAGNAAWDWGFTTFIGLVRGPLLPEQLPGFATLPERVEGANVGGLLDGARMVTMANTPAAFDFALTGSERELDFSGGLMPGSYEHGETDGAAFVVELVAPDGTVRELFRRLLQPRTTPGDRGDQSMRVALPPYATGARLRLRTDPGPAGNAAWDWVYLTSCRLR
ncbi:MAG: hypothetical protein JSR48_02880 [Verrucomicrobia bacterium]|nr:hypothetical protein [Verrucomicrobiota bacterium]